MQAQDVMTTKVISVGPDTPVQEVAALLLEHKISAVPVVDAEGQLVGVVSEGDLIHRLEDERAARRSWWLSLVASPEEQAQAYLKTHGHVVRDVMTTPVVTVAPTTPVSEIAHLLDSRRIKRVPVVQDGRVIGIVSRGDLLRALALHRERTVTADDRALCEQVMAKFQQAGLDWRPYVTVIVTGGTAHLWGMAASAGEAEQLKHLAEEVVGKGKVESHLGLRDLHAKLRPGSSFMA